MTRVLAIETSCDDTSVAVVESSGRVLACRSADQNREHEAYGGIVPEIASRNHIIHLMPLVDRVFAESGVRFNELSGVVATQRPGLIGSLLVGWMTAKGLAVASGKPCLGVHHLEGHLLAPFLFDEKMTAVERAEAEAWDFPYLALAVSGGHTTLYRVDSLHEIQALGATRDDAAGEAFDKFGKLVGLGFPGGVRVDKWARLGDPRRFPFPRPLLSDPDSGLDFSFSGLKTAAIRLLDTQKSELAAEPVSDAEQPVPGLRADLCAGFQQAVVDTLMARLQAAQKQTGLRRVAITGGVAANSELRRQLGTWTGLQTRVPPLRYCTDNAAMIGLVGSRRLALGEFSALDSGVMARASLGST